MTSRRRGIERRALLSHDSPEFHGGKIKARRLREAGQWSPPMPYIRKKGNLIQLALPPSTRQRPAASRLPVTYVLKLNRSSIFAAPFQGPSQKRYRNKAPGRQLTTHQ